MAHTKVARAAGLFSVAAAAVACGEAHAQEKSSAIEEIVVTALRREQNLQEVPAAIAVMTGEDIKAKGAQDLRDYLTTMPGVTYSENNIGGMRVTIRGISDGLVGSTDPLAGIYIDEAPVTESSAATLDPDIYDVERVEVLKGPQGTLYGSGSMGGTVRIIGNKPKLGVFEAVADGTLTTITDGGEGGRVDGVVNVPVSDQLALRVSAGYREDGGWIEDLPRNDSDANTVEKQNVRSQLLYKPADSTSVILGFLYQKEERGLPPFDDPALPGYQTRRIFRQSGESEAKLFSLTLNHDFAGANLIAASNYLRKDSTNQFATNFNPNLVRLLTGVTLGPADGLGLNFPTDTKLFTQEVRLASSGENRLDWLVGAFYSDASSELTEQFDVSQAPSLAAVITGEEFYNSRGRKDTRQVAGFGELTFDVTEKLSVTGGLRVFDVRERNLAHTTGLLNDGETIENTSADMSSTTKKVSLQYQANGDHLVYLQASQGYRNGGANSEIPLATCGPALAAAGYQSAPGEFGSDDLWNYELGSKNTFFDGRIQLNAAAFYIDWSEIQNTVGLADCGLTFVTNAGSAETKGVEIDAAWRLTDRLSVNVSGSRIDSELTSVAPGGSGREGDPLPFAPEWSWSVNAHYAREFGSLTGFVRGELNYVGERWTDFRSVARAVELDDYTTASARIGVETGRWSAAVFGSNLTNERIVVNIIGTNANVSRPRTVGVNLRVQF